MASSYEKSKNTVRSFVNRACGVNTNYDGFPGGLPVSINRNSLKKIAGIGTDIYTEYAVAFKTDGTRQILGFLCVEGDFLSFIMDRTADITFIDLKMYPLLYEGSLFDVETLQNTIVIFDCMCFHGNNCNNQFYPTRLELARYMLSNSVVEMKYSSRLAVTRDSRMYPSSFDDIFLSVSAWTIKVKTIFYSNCVGRLPKSWLYPDDGFIWTLTSAPYHHKGGTMGDVLKWKPPTKISIDFRITDRFNGGYIECLPHSDKNLDNKYRSPSGNCYLLTEDNGDTIWFTSVYLDGYQPGIYEFMWDTNSQIWAVLHRRSDKVAPNSLYTVYRTIENIEENITRECLFV